MSAASTVLIMTPENAAVGFVAALRGAGLPVAPTSSALFVQALAAVGVDNGQKVFWAGRATLVHRPEDHALYEQVFAVYWNVGETGLVWQPPSDPDPLTMIVDDEDEDGPEGDGTAPEGDTITVRYSAYETLSEKDFSEYTDEELAEARQLMARVRLTGSPRTSRRSRRSKHLTPQPDLRRTVRAALRTGGEPIRRFHRRPSQRPRRLVLLLDVSGSMEPYARALIRFVQAAVAGRTQVEAFTIGTRMTRLTRELSSRDPDRALRAAAASVADWSGGTRLGEGLAEFNNQWGCRGMARGATVVIMSDGWDRGDPEVMAEQMQRLQRVAHQLVWVNPLKASPGYAPLARGMAAALPFVDRFVEGHSIRSLEHLAAIILNADAD